MPQAEVAKEQLAHPADMACVGVVALLGWFVAATETHQVGGDHPMPGRNEHGDHVAVEVAPGGLTVHQQYRGGIGRALVEVVHPHGATVRFIGLNLGVVRGKRVADQVGEPVVGCAHGLHGRLLKSGGTRAGTSESNTVKRFWESASHNDQPALRWFNVRCDPNRRRSR